MNISKIEVWLEEKLKLIHKKFFLIIVYIFLSSIVLGVIVRCIGPSVPLRDLPMLNYVIVKVSLLVMCIFGPVGYMLAIIGLKKDWVEKPQWFKDKFNI